jgi:pyrroline-5-carboxylate reductase
MRIGVIGLGNMGGAIAKGLTETPGLELAGYDANEEFGRRTAESCGMTFCQSAAEACAEADFVILAVKPQIAGEVVQNIAKTLSPAQCLISIAAGVPLKKLTKWSAGACPVVRVMPNTPALVGAGVFGICLDHSELTSDQKNRVTELFAILGHPHVLPESMFDAFTGLIGSGPAYVLYCMEALVDAGVTQGIPRPQATEMVQTLFSGTARMTEEMDAPLSRLREMVTSPGGTTIAGLNTLDKHGVRYGLIDGVKKASKRSRELG